MRRRGRGNLGVWQWRRRPEVDWKMPKWKVKLFKVCLVREKKNGEIEIFFYCLIEKKKMRK